MTGSRHAAILRFPAHEDQISELMRSNVEFAEICGDYAQIVADIARQERALSHGRAVLGDLLRLKADLERDIIDWLSMIEESAAAPGEDLSDMSATQ